MEKWNHALNYILNEAVLEQPCSWILWNNCEFYVFWFPFPGKFDLCINKITYTYIQSVFIDHNHAHVLRQQFAGMSCKKTKQKTAEIDILDQNLKRCKNIGTHIKYIKLLINPILLS